MLALLTKGNGLIFGNFADILGSVLNLGCDGLIN